MTRTLRTLALCAAATFSAAGCQHIANTPPISLSSNLKQDEAMTARNWDPVTVKYPSGATVAGSTGFMYESKDKCVYQNSVQDAPLFLGNVGLMPYTLFRTPPWKPVTWRGETVEPTYTATPPLPAE